MSEKNITKKCHVLPQRYLAGFTNTCKKDGKFFAYDLVKGALIGNATGREGISTKGVARRRHLFTIYNEEEKLWDDSMEELFAKKENFLSKVIENIFSEFSRIGKEGSSIKLRAEREQCILDLIILLLRKIISERFICDPKELISGLAKDRYKEALLKYEDVIYKYGHEEMLSESRIQTYTTSTKFNNAIKRIFGKYIFSSGDIECIMSVLMMRNRMFSVLNKGEYEFVISDFPLYIYPDTKAFIKIISDPSTELSIPLNKDIFLTIGGGFERKREYCVLDSYCKLKYLITEANKRIVANARRFIASSKKSILQDMIKIKELNSNDYPENFFACPKKLIESINKEK